MHVTCCSSGRRQRPHWVCYTALILPMRALTVSSGPAYMMGLSVLLAFSETCIFLNTACLVHMLVRIFRLFGTG